jgi:hypothetical protein
MFHLPAWTMRAALPALLCLLTGCGTLQSVPIKDNESPAFAVRGTWHAKQGEASRSSGPGIEAGYEGYRARDTQQLAAGQSILLEGGAIVGPDTLRHEARLRMGYVAYHHRFRFGSFELEPFGGVTRVHLKVRTDTASGSSIPSFDEVHTGGIGGVTPRWRFTDGLAAEFRFSYFSAGAWAHGESYEAALVLSPAPQVSLRVGYSERKHDVEAFVPGWYSEVNIRARGPMATLQFDF